MSGRAWAIGRTGSRVIVHVAGRMHPEASDSWDGNWLTTEVDVHVGAFRANIPAALRSDELRRFREEVETLYGALSGSARLESMEDWIQLSVEVDGLGHIRVEGQIRDEAGMGNRLLFEIKDLDQTDLPDLIRELAEVDAAYPVLGHH